MAVALVVLFPVTHKFAYRFSIRVGAVTKPGCFPCNRADTEPAPGAFGAHASERGSEKPDTVLRRRRRACPLCAEFPEEDIGGHRAIRNFSG
jgi:hypothetical protein